jgi:membrane protein DedA with SNARE-associated domain
MMFFFGCAIAAIAWAVIVYVLIPMITNASLQKLMMTIMIILGILICVYLIFVGVEFARGGPGLFDAWPRR